MAALPRKHLAILGALFLLFLAGRFWLAPYFLMLDGNSGVQGIFGFADAAARVRGYQALPFITLVAAGVVGWAGFRSQACAPHRVRGGGGLGGLVLVQLYPELVQRFQVEPNELDRETPYIEANLEFTRMGFGLDELRDEGVRLLPSRLHRTGEWPPSSSRAFPFGPPGASSPPSSTWSPVPLLRLRNVTVDRYPIRHGGMPVAVAVREIDPDGIGDPNWQNLHLRTLYLAGWGPWPAP